MPKNARLWLETSAGDELEKKKRAGHHLYAHRYPSPPCEQTELSWFETNKTADPTDCACTPDSTDLTIKDEQNHPNSKFFDHLEFSIPLVLCSAPCVAHRCMVNLRAFSL